MLFVLVEYAIEGRGASEIAASIERGVASGDLPPGRLLPPMRKLAASLGSTRTPSPPRTGPCVSAA
ncbi:GntR family transcriptional regulator [Streptomyces sp. I6]|nr:GntR family transcriptional regulator [Streptomyces sp. I6]